MRLGLELDLGLGLHRRWRVLVLPCWWGRSGGVKGPVVCGRRDAGIDGLECRVPGVLRPRKVGGPWRGLLILWRLRVRMVMCWGWHHLPGTRDGSYCCLWW